MARDDQSRERRARRSCAAWKTERLSDSAPGRSSCGTRRGIKACRAGPSKATALAAEQVHSVEQPERLAVREGEPRERERDAGHGELRGEHERRRSLPVRDDARPEREDDDRNDARQSDEAERQRRARQQVDVPVDRDRLHLRADRGRRAARAAAAGSRGGAGRGTGRGRWSSSRRRAILARGESLALALYLTANHEAHAIKRS